MKITRIAVILLLGILLVSGLACAGGRAPTPTPTPTTTCQLYTYVDGQGLVSPSSGTFSEGDTVTLSAIPASGWQFDHWAGDAIGSQSPITISVYSDKTITAVFTRIEYILSASVSPSASGSISPYGGTFDAGTRVTLTARPASGWRFDHWSGDAYGTSSTVTVTMDSSKSVTAHFVHPPITITLDKVGVYGCGDGWERGSRGEQYLYVLVTDGTTTQELRVPSQEHFRLASNEDVSVGLTIFSTQQVDDYLYFAVTGWEHDGGGLEPLIYSALGSAAAAAIGAETGGAGVLLEPILEDLIGSLFGAADDYLGTYEQIWYASDSWGVGEYTDISTNDLRLWFTIEEQ